MRNIPNALNDAHAQITQYLGSGEEQVRHECEWIHGMALYSFKANGTMDLLMRATLEEIKNES